VGIFSDIGNAKTFERGSFLRPGKHRIRTEATKIVNARSGKVYHCTEAVVLESEGGATFAKSEQGWEDVPTKAVPGHNPGEKVTIMFEVAPDPDQMGMGNLKEMLAAYAGVEPEMVEEGDADASVSEEQPLKGQELEVHANAVITRASNLFTRLSFYNVG